MHTNNSVENRISSLEENVSKILFIIEKLKVDSQTTVDTHCVENSETVASLKAKCKMLERKYRSYQTNVKLSLEYSILVYEGELYNLLAQTVNYFPAGGPLPVDIAAIRKKVYKDNFEVEDKYCYSDSDSESD